MKIIIKKGITCKQICDKMKKQFPCSLYGEYNEQAKKTYNFIIQDSEEASKVYENIPNSITLLEYMTYHLLYFLKTKKHLDSKHITVCAGSKYPNGTIPTAMFGTKGLKIHWCNPNERNPRLRTRTVQRYENQFKK